MICRPEDAAVLVTGASSGIGRACALALAERGVLTFAAVRSEQDFESLRREARRYLTPVLLDVVDSGHIAAAVESISAALQGRHFTGLVNNAGIMLTGPLEYVSSHALHLQMQVNVVGQMAVTRAFLPLLRNSGGRIVNMGSTSAHIVSAFTGPYCASKFALLALTDALRMELRPSGIHVALIEPGLIATPLWAKVMSSERTLAAELPAEGKRFYSRALMHRQQLLHRLNGKGAAPETVANAVLHALLSKRPKARYLLDVKSRVKIPLAKILPDRLRLALTELRSRKTA